MSKGKRVILFAPLLKATTMREVTVPAYTRHDGTFVPMHRRTVRVSLDQPTAEIASGRGSTTQREAHARLSRVIPGFAGLPEEHRAAHVLAVAHDLQDARGHARDLSGWRQNAAGGRNPTPSQWSAFRRLESEQRATEIARVVERHGSTGHLREPVEPAAAPAPEPSAIERVAQASTTGPVEPQPESERLRMASAMRQVQFPTDVDGWSQSPTNEQCRRRLRQLREMADSGDFDGITNFSTSRTRANYSLVADYRDDLLEAAHEARTAAASAPAPATQPSAAAIPHPPEITGANPQNTALVAAQRKVRALYAAAQSDDPVTAILAIPTSRGNGYMNRADDYKTALLAHFGHTAAGTQVHENAAPRRQRQQSEAARPVPAAPDGVAPAQPQPAQPGRTERPAPKEQDPVYAANPECTPIIRLGFVPRPNVPIEWVVRQDGAWIASVGVLVPWPDNKFKQLAKDYLGQSAALQRRAKTHQVVNSSSLEGFLHPSFREARQQADETARRMRESAASRAREDAARSAAQTRAAASAFLDSIQNMPELHRPRSPVGANVSQLNGDSLGASLKFGVERGAFEAMMKSMVADYGAGETFKIKIDASAVIDNFSVSFTGDKGTYIKRNFEKRNGGWVVDHSFFQAGTRGAGSAKALFRVSIGVYKALGVKVVKVHANIDVGGYAWAKFGFVPNERSWGLLKERIGKKLDRTLGVTDAAKREVRRLLNSSDPTSMFSLSDLKDGERSLGKELLLGSNWFGDLSLNDSVSYRRCIGYISQGRG